MTPDNQTSAALEAWLDAEGIDSDSRSGYWKTFAEGLEGLLASRQQGEAVGDKNPWRADREPTAADADSNGDVVWLRSGLWDVLGRVATGRPVDASVWKYTDRYLSERPALPAPALPVAQAGGCLRANGDVDHFLDCKCAPPALSEGLTGGNK